VTNILKRPSTLHKEENSLNTSVYGKGREFPGDLPSFDENKSTQECHNVYRNSVPQLSLFYDKSDSRQKGDSSVNVVNTLRTG